MSITFGIIGLILLFLSFIGCVLPVVPGPALALLGMSSLYFTSTPPSGLMISVAVAVAAIATVLDYAVPAISAKKFKCSSSGVWGCLIGSVIGFVLATAASFFLTIFVGAIVLIVGLMLGPFIGTMAGELLAKRSLSEAFDGGIGAVVGFLVAVILKLIACLIIAIQFLWTWIA